MKIFAVTSVFYGDKLDIDDALAIDAAFTTLRGAKDYVVAAMNEAREQIESVDEILLDDLEWTQGPDRQFTDDESCETIYRITELTVN